MLTAGDVLDAVAEALRRVLPPWRLRQRPNPLGGLPDWMRTVLELRQQDVPTELIIPSILPIVDVMNVATRPVAGSQTLAAPGTPEQLPNITAALVSLQANPGNLDNILLGFGNGNLPIVLQPGQSVEASVSNVNVFFFDSSGANPVTIAFTALQVV